MLLCFVDESFKDDFYGFAAVIADELATKSLTGAINHIMQQAAVDFGVPAKAEVHGYPLFHGSEEWKGVGARARIRVWQQVVEAIASHDVRLLMRSVDRAKLTSRQARESYPVNFPAEQVCFQHILQRTNTLAGSASTYALVIADERGDRDRHRERFAMYQVEGTPGVYMHTRLDRLLDTVHFAPSHHSRMLQAADLVAFTHRRHSTVRESDPRAQAVMDQSFDKLERRTYDLGSWPL